MSVTGSNVKVVGKGETTITATAKINGKVYTDSLVYFNGYTSVSTNQNATLYTVNSNSTPSSLALSMTADGENVTDNTVFTTNNNQVVKIENGVVTALQAGSATITATFTFYGRNYTDTFTVTVVDNTPNLSTNSDATLYLVNKTGSQQKELTLFAKNGNTDITSSVIFSSSAPAIAKVEGTKLVALSFGQAVITASYTIGDTTFTATFNVTVVDNTPVLSGNANATLYTYEKSSQTPTELSLFLFDGSVDVTANTVFASNNANVAQISGTTVVANSQGSAQITATYVIDGASYMHTFTVTVIDNAPKFSSLGDTTLYLTQKDSQPTGIELYAKDGDENVTAQTTFTVDDVTVAGIEGVTLYAKRVGTTFVTATYELDGDVFTATFNLTVIDNSVFFTVNGQRAQTLTLHTNSIYGDTGATLGLELANGQAVDADFAIDRAGVIDIAGQTATVQSGGKAIISATYTVGETVYTVKINAEVIADIPTLVGNDNASLYVYGAHQGDLPSSLTLSLTDGGVDVTAVTEFISSNPAVASVSGTTVTAQSAGEAVITAKYASGGYLFTEQFLVTVHGIIQIEQDALLSIYDGRVSFVQDGSVISATLGGSALTVNNGVIDASALTANTQTAQEMLVVSSAGVYSLNSVYVYDRVIFNEADFYSYFGYPFTNEDVKNMITFNEDGSYKSVSYAQYTRSGYIALANDITLSKAITDYPRWSYTGGTAAWTNEHATFTGTFDGFNHTISGLTFGNSRYNGYGLFGKLVGATVKNVAFTNVVFGSTYQSAIGYSADANTTIQNVMVEVDRVYDNGNLQGALFYSLNSATGATYNNVLVVYPECVGLETAGYGGGPLGYMTASSWTGTKVTNFYVISKTKALATNKASKAFYGALDSASDLSAYTSTYALDGSGYISSTKHVKVTRYDSFEAMLSAGITSVGNWTYNGLLGDYAYTNGNDAIITTLNDITMVSGSDTVELFVYVNGVKFTGATFTSNNTQVATVSGTTLSAVGVGEATITATATVNGSTVTRTFKVTSQSGTVQTISQETLVSIQDGKILGFEQEVLAVRQGNTMATVQDGVITGGLTVYTQTVQTTVNGQVSTNEHVAPCALTVFTANGVYVFTNVLVYDKVLTTAEEAFDTFDTYNNGEYGITTGYYALANNIDMRYAGIVRHSPEQNRDTKYFANSFSTTDANGNTVYKQGGFQGYLDGRGYYLSFNATMGGLFGRLRAGSVVKNIAFRNVALPIYNVGDYFNEVICYSADGMGSNILIQDVYVSVEDFTSKASGERTSTIMFQYSTASYVHLKNVVVDVVKPTEEGKNPNYGYGALWVRDEYRNPAIENVYLISGEKMLLAGLLGTTSYTYATFAGNENVESYAGAKTIYKYDNVTRYNTISEMGSLTTKLSNADVWARFNEVEYSVRVNGVETSNVTLYTTNAGSYKDHATVYSYMNAVKFNATYEIANQNVVVYENEQLVAKGVGSTTVTVKYGNQVAKTLNVTVKEIDTISSASDFNKLANNPTGTFVITKDITFDNYTASAFTFRGVLDGDGNSIRGVASGAILGALNGATIKNLGVWLDEGSVITSATDSYIDNVCVIGDINVTGLTVTNSVLDYVEYDTMGDRTGFNSNYWDKTYGLDYKFKLVYEGTHVYDYTVTDKYLLNNGVTDYILILPDSAENITALQKAKDEFIRLFRRATGVRLEVYYESSTAPAVEQAKDSGKYISIGATNLAIALDLTTKDLGSDGHVIKTVGNSIYILGGDNSGSLFGVYTFMNICFNFETYYKDCVVIDTGVRTLKLYNFNVTDIPDMETRTQSHGFLNSNSADTNINGVVYTATMENKDVNSSEYNTVYNDAEFAAERMKISSSDVYMNILSDAFYEVDANNQIIVSSFVDTTTGEITSQGLLDVSQKLINIKSINGTSIHNTSEFFPFDPTYYSDSVSVKEGVMQGNLNEGYETSWQEIYLSDRTPASVNTQGSIRMICFTTHGDQTAYNYLVNQFANKLIQSIIVYEYSNISKNAAIIMNEDNGLHCDCANCMAAIQKYGSRSGAELLFTNDVYKVVKAWMDSIKDHPVMSRYYKEDFILYYAPYGETSTAPIINGRPTIDVEDGVGLYLCVSRTLDYQQSIYNEINDYGRNDLIKSWAMISNNYLTWLYQTNFSNYMMLYDTYGTFDGPGYAFYANLGVNQMSNQSQSGQRGSATGFHALQAYLDYKLRWDTSLDADVLADEWFSAMYGSNVNIEGTSAWYMKKMFIEMRETSAEYCSKYGLYTAPSHNHYNKERSYWTLDKVQRWLDYCDAATLVAPQRANATIDGTVARHIAMEKLSPLYMAIELYRNEFTYGEYLSIIEEFKQICHDVGIQNSSEGAEISAYIDSLPTGVFSSSNSNVSCSVGEVINLDLMVKMSDYVEAKSAITDNATVITSSNTDVAVVEGTTVRVVGDGYSKITISYVVSGRAVAQLSFFVTCNIQNVGEIQISGYNGADADASDQVITDTTMFDSGIVSIVSDKGEELLVNGKINLTNNTNAVLYENVIVTTQNGTVYLATLAVYTRFIDTEEEFIEVFLTPDFVYTVEHVVLKNGASNAEVVASYSTANADDLYNLKTVSGKKYFDFEYVLQTGDVRQADRYTMSSKSIVGAYALVADIDMAGANFSTYDDTYQSYNGTKLVGVNGYITHRIFDGVFDGNGKTVSNITFGHRGGVFGKLGAGSIVRNFAFTGVKLTGTNQTAIAYSAGVGATVENVYIQIVDLAEVKGNANGGYGNRQAAIVYDSGNSKEYVLTNVLVEFPEAVINDDYGFGFITTLAQNAVENIPTVTNFVAISATDVFACYANAGRVWVAENEQSKIEAGGKYENSGMKVVITGASRYEDSQAAQSAGVTSVGNWHITYSGTGASTTHTVSWVK